MKKSLSWRLWNCALMLCVAIPFGNAYAKKYTLNSRASGAADITFDKQSQNWRVELQINEFNADDSDQSNGLLQSSDISFEGLSLTNDEGLARRPYKSFVVAVAKEDLKVSIESQSSQLFKGLYSQVSPTKPCRCPEAGEKVNYKVSQDYFNNQRLYKLESLGDYRGVPLTKVTLYGAIQRESGLEVYSGLRFNLQSQVEIEEAEDVLDFEEQNKKMLVISAETLMAGAQYFVDYKSAQGFDVDFYKYEDIATDATGLQSFIQSQYAAVEYQYAVLVGSENLVPTFYVETSNSWQTPTDYLYFHMGGEDDYLPEVFYSRLTGTSSDQIMNQVDRFREYAEQSWSDGNGLYRTIGIASNEGVNPSDVEYVQGMLSPLATQYGVEADYFLQNDERSNVQQINSSLNLGAHWLSYIGHGSGTSWPSITTDSYTSQDVYSLEAGHVKPVVIDVACQNGRFNDQGRLGETLINATVNGENVGAVAYFGGSVDISWDPPAIMSQGISESVAADGSRLALYGHILAGQKYLLYSYSNFDAAKENLVWYHLLGDPSQEIFFQ